MYERRCHLSGQSTSVSASCSLLNGNIDGRTHENLDKEYIQKVRYESRIENNILMHINEGQ